MLLYQRQPPQRNCQIVKLPLCVFLLNFILVACAHFFFFAQRHCRLGALTQAIGPADKFNLARLVLRPPLTKIKCHLLPPHLCCIIAPIGV